MLLIRADSTNAEDLPPNLPAYAGYTDGAWPSFAAIAKRFRGLAHLTSITTRGGPAQIADVEAGDLSPTAAARWLADQLADPRRPRQRHGLYFALVDLEIVRAAIADLTPKLRRAEYLLWGAHWTGTLPRTIPDGLDALQCENVANAGYDISVVAPSWFAPRPVSGLQGADRP